MIVHICTNCEPPKKLYTQFINVNIIITGYSHFELKYGMNMTTIYLLELLDEWLIQRAAA